MKTRSETHKKPADKAVDELPKAEWRMIDAAEADRILAKGDRNRPLNERFINQLRDEMLAGHWKANGETIIFDTNGRLVDGQHRLNAIVRTGKAFLVLVVTGVPSDVFSTVDIGRSRSAADTLSLGDEKEAKKLASTLVFVAKYLGGHMLNRGFSLTPTQAVELLVDHPGVRDSVAFVAGVGKPIMSFSILAGAHYLFSRKDKKLADEMVTKLVTGVGLDEGNPILILRERMLANKAGYEKLRPEAVAALTIKAMKHYIKGDKLPYLRYRGTGERAEAFPSVD